MHAAARQLTSGLPDGMPAAAPGGHRFPGVHDNSHSRRVGVVTHVLPGRGGGLYNPELRWSPRNCRAREILHKSHGDDRAAPRVGAGLINMYEMAGGIFS
jgi:hypothetical protein